MCGSGVRIGQKGSNRCLLECHGTNLDRCRYRFELHHGQSSVDADPEALLDARPSLCCIATKHVTRCFLFMLKAKPLKYCSDSLAYGLLIQANAFRTRRGQNFERGGMADYV